VQRQQVRAPFNRCTAHQNKKTGFDVDGGSKSKLTANLSIGNATAVALGSSTASGNSWNIGGTWALQSTDQATITGARTSDGLIRSSNFLLPANGTAVGAKTLSHGHQAHRRPISQKQQRSLAGNPGSLSLRA
jgi:hypothetical protein